VHGRDTAEAVIIAPDGPAFEEKKLSDLSASGVRCMKLNRRERQQGTRWRHRLSKERRRSEAPEQQQSQKAQDYQAHQARDGASGPKRQCLFSMNGG
jgi:hypothetical protein